MPGNFTDERPNAFPWVKASALAIVAILLFRFASQGQGFDFRKFFAVLSDLDPGYTFLAIFFIVLSYLGRAIRWEVMMRPLGAPISFSSMLSATTIGFASVVLLGRAGEFVRPWLVARASKTSFSAQMAVWLFERIYDLLVVIVFFGYGLVYLSQTSNLTHLGPELRWVIASGGGLALAGGLFCLIFVFALRFLSPSQRQGLNSLLGYLPPRLAQRLRPLAENFLEGAIACCDGRLQGLVMAYTFLEWVVIAACQWSLFQAFSATAGLNASQVISIVGLVSFGSIVQLPGIGGGMQVAAIAVLTQIFSVGLEEAAGIALALWVISFVLVVPVGLVLAVRQGLQFQQLRRLE
ncbi:MAG: lysylphosphatidylglycerol synthase transmembrane domain-containing protein [Bryobacter sp.]|nr:lysylphosphatidylglycerol synthase transmembrane domain-containing protein [Bryobacter sp.]